MLRENISNYIRLARSQGKSDEEILKEVEEIFGELGRNIASEILASETSVNDLSDVDRNLKKVDLLEERKKLCEAFISMRNSKIADMIIIALLSFFISFLLLYNITEHIDSFYNLNDSSNITFSILFSILATAIVMVTFEPGSGEYKRVLREYNEKLANIFREWAENLSQEEFENAMNTMIKKLGLTIASIREKREKELYVEALDRDNNKIVVKCINSKDPIGLSMVKELNNSLESGEIKLAYLITTNQFTQGALAFVNDKPIKLFDWKDVKRYVGDLIMDGFEEFDEKKCLEGQYNEELKKRLEEKDFSYQNTEDKSIDEIDDKDIDKNNMDKGIDDKLNKNNRKSARDDTIVIFEILLIFLTVLGIIIVFTR